MKKIIFVLLVFVLLLISGCKTIEDYVPEGVTVVQEENPLISSCRDDFESRLEVKYLRKGVNIEMGGEEILITIDVEKIQMLENIDQSEEFLNTWGNSMEKTIFMGSNLNPRHINNWEYPWVGIIMSMNIQDSKVNTLLLCNQYGKLDEYSEYMLQNNMFLDF